ncbi:hypothetical protein ACFSKW_00460 [Nonomuraea mangrovi]|uniref:Uncharacterized protein n=1 Tax=Nonomuraea mangrovi TaxID=2316207 RepID=A0ABW4SK70_9ACTN
MIVLKNVLAFGAAAAFIFVGPATLPPEITGADTVAAAHYTASTADPGPGNGIGLGGTNAGGGGSNRNN